MANQSLFEEPLLDDLDEEAISSLGSFYEKVVRKKVYDLLRDSTPFQMAALVSIHLYLCCSLPLFVFDIATIVDEHFLHLYGKVLQHMATPTKSTVSFEGKSLGDVQEGRISGPFPQLEKNLEEARLKWVDLAKEHVVLANEVK